MRSKRSKFILIVGILFTAALFLAACAAQDASQDASQDIPEEATETAPSHYHQIPQEEAMAMMEEDDGHIVVDVRTAEEYQEGHIPGAICIPNETIGDEMPSELPDLNQIILIYCRSGNRSKQAAQKLLDMGYTNIYEFGGINTWPGEIVKEGADDMTDGMTEDEMAEAIRPVPTLVIEAGGSTFYASFEDNSSAEAFCEKLSEGAVTVDMHDYNSFEKVGPLPWDLPTNDERITTQPGDVILYQGNQITIYYDENTWEFTRMARIEGATKDALLEAFGDGDVSITFRVEWSE